MIRRWTSFEVASYRADGELERPFSAELFGPGDPTQTALQKMRLLEHHGWPDARKKLTDKRGRTRIDRADGDTPEIYILKGKPSCWRLYFCVYPATRRVVYLHAACKQTQRRDPNDSVVARNRLAGIAGIAEFEFP